MKASPQSRISWGLYMLVMSILDMIFNMLDAEPLSFWNWLISFCVSALGLHLVITGWEILSKDKRG